MTYKVGDTVKLKSGGPIMTVHDTPKTQTFGNQTHYTCQWFAGKKLESGHFERDQLEPAKPEPVANGS